MKLDFRVITMYTSFHPTIGLTLEALSDLRVGLQLLHQLGSSCGGTILNGCRAGQKTKACTWFFELLKPWTVFSKLIRPCQHVGAEDYCHT